MTAGDVVRAIREQNAQVATGIDRQPAGPRRPELRDHAQHAGPARQRRRVREHHSQDDRRRADRADQGHRPASNWAPRTQDVSVMFDGKPTVFMPIFQLPDANALETHDRIVAKMDDLATGFSRGRELGDQLRHHALHARIDQRGVQDAARRDHSGGRRGAGVLAELAIGDHSAGGRAGGHHRHVRRHGRCSASA